MKSGGYFAILGYFATRLVVIEIVILALTGLVCWWIGHWTLAGYSNGLSWAGGLVILFGLINLFGGSDQNEGQKLSTSLSASPKIPVSPKQGIEVSSIPPSKAHL